MAENFLILPKGWTFAKYGHAAPTLHIIFCATDDTRFKKMSIRGKKLL